jgi:hypothetical protein
MANKAPAVRDRSMSNPSLGEVTGRSDLSTGFVNPSKAVVPGANSTEVPQAEGNIEPCTAAYAGGDHGSISDRTAGKAQGPVTARPTAGPLSNQPSNFTPAANKAAKAAHADLTTNKLATGPAVSNPNFGYMNSRS